MLRVLAVDDELPALEELAYLLRADERIAQVETAQDGTAALRCLDRALAEGRPLDAVFLDIRMPGLDGLVVARVLSRFAHPPQVVFVTAYDDFAVAAFELKAIDYLLKPMRAERVAEAVRRVCEAVEMMSGQAGAGQAWAGAEMAEDETIPVELGGVTRFVRRAEVRYVEAQGDYARLHTADASHLIRMPLTTLEERWKDAGFVRVHRSHLVALRHIDEVRMESGRVSVRVGDELIPVSRRSTRELRDRLMRQAKARPEPRTDRGAGGGYGERGYGERGAGGGYGERGYGERGYGERGYGERSVGERGYGERSVGERGYGGDGSA